MRKRYPSLQRIVGSSGAGVIGTGKAGPQELEDEPAVSVTLGCLPQVNTSSFHVTEGSLPDADSSPAEWQALSGVEIDSPGNTSFVVMSNPQFGGIVDLLAGLDFAFPEATKIGGLSSSHNMGAPTATFSWSSRQKADEPEHGVLQTGAVVLVLQGNLVMEPIIAQGCQALSDRIWAIDKMAHNNMLLELTSVSGKRTSCTALKALQMDIEGLPPAARASAGANLTMSVAPDDFKDTSKLDAADFLVRGLLGADPRSGSIAIGESVRLGQRVRFMQRGREGAMQDLQNMGLAYKRRQLQASMEGKSGPAPFGALMFTCNGRGRNLYKEADYDSRTLTSFIPVPVSGFFCNGEIGQVGKSTYLHGFTCAAAILRPAPPDNHA
ncbi:hypothetical protein WJX72_001714 [[Myrmecia] bisecta]|uniref:FIST C-domain domain-containing protein n=1 Tax=[Myrmecia] bisecta TaxID=41462 RepID=A0AAW1NZI8_9CHLO